MVALTEGDIKLWQINPNGMKSAYRLFVCAYSGSCILHERGYPHLGVLLPSDANLCGLKTDTLFTDVQAKGGRSDQRRAAPRHGLQVPAVAEDLGGELPEGEDRYSLTRPTAGLHRAGAAGSATRGDGDQSFSEASPR